VHASETTFDWTQKMNKLLSVVASLALFAASAVHAQNILPVQGTGATGAPGDRVFVSLTYDYGTGFEAIAEDLQFEYDSTVLSFLFPDSTVVRGGVSQSLADHIADLNVIARAGDSSASFNLAPSTLPLGRGGFRLAFTQPDLFGFPGDIRTGQVVFNAAFEIAAAAQDGPSLVSFSNSTLTDFQSVTFEFIEYGYPSALRNVQVTVQAAVVPEPEMALMLLPGLALIGWQVRRRRARQNHSA
jgi:hypothetical protein